jgi:signal transduction histidine kinase/ActR/RegA family two-component response regulator
VNSRVEAVDRRGWRWSGWLARLSSGVGLLAVFALPMLPLLTLIFMASVPDEVRAHSTPLVGPWKVLASDQAGLGDVGVDDSGWENIELPSNFALRGPRGNDYWLRRTISLPYDGRSQFLLLGNIRNGIADLYVNGRFVGRNESTLDSYQTNFMTQQGWEIPPNMLNDGNNVLAMHISWRKGTGNFGLVDRRLSIGPTNELRPYFVRARLVSALLTLGSLAVCVLLFALLFAVRVATPARQRTGRLTAVLLLLGAVVFYNSAVSGLLTVPVQMSDWTHLSLCVLAVVFIVPAFWVFVENEYLGLLTLRPRLNLPVMLCFGIGNILYPIVFTPLFFVYVVLSVGYLFLVSIRGAFRDPRLQVLVKTWALVVVGLSGLMESIGGLGIAGLPGMFPHSLMSLGVVAAVSLILEFIDIARKNQMLSSSLAITNADLAGALVRAQEGTRLKSELLATVSHELRTPLNSIINIPEGLLEDFVENEEGWAYAGAPERTVSYLRRIGSSGRHLLSIVDDVLEFSRLNAGKLPLQFQSVSVGALLGELRDIVEPLAKEKTVSLVFPAHLPEAPLRADGLRVKQVLLNLVGNAIKFSNAGGTIEIIVASESDSYVFSVRDEGIGIAPEHQKLIFESFRQVDGGTTRPFGGTGLGLAIAHDLVSLHGGKIWVTSELGKGSTFAFRLPVEGPPQSAVSPIQTLPNESRTIVIVDDDATTLETIKLALRSLDCLLVGTTESRSALGLVKELKPALVVLDLMMPHFSGFDLLGQLRGEIETGSLRVLVTSAYHEHEAQARSLGAGWVPKPWDGTQLAEAAASLMAQVPPAEARGSAPEHVSAA